jgi:hypothetical protein
MMNKILVSACLMGFRVRYNGSEKARMNEPLARWQQNNVWLSTALNWLPGCLYLVLRQRLCSLMAKT